MPQHQLSRRDARRIAVRAQLLDSPRPDDLLDVARHLAGLQHDRTKAVAPNADLVAWSRLGSANLHRDEVACAVDEQRLIDVQGMLRPAEDLVLFRAEMSEWPGTDDVPAWRLAQADWVDANDDFRRDVLEVLRRDGPLTWRDVPDTSIVPWRSSGWNNNRNAAMMLEMLVHKGEVACAGHDGRDRLWDLAERVYPDDEPAPTAEAERTRNERRLHALGIARAKGPACAVERTDVDDVGETAVVDGVRGEWRVDPMYLDGSFTGRTAILSPLDRLIYDRTRMTDLFAFDYQLEMYKPKAKRRWGYWALPILHGDEFVGKVDATTDLKRGVLQVDAIHEDVPFSRTLTANVTRELRDLATWLGVELLRPT